jgi:hypothetical protein
MENPPVEPLDPRLEPRLDEAVRRWNPKLESIRTDLGLQLAASRDGGRGEPQARPGS